ncbi:MAG: RAMP superfamily CRISPR-associated protein [Desulfovibrio sp.]|jgi:CRISPR-associated protein Csm5|nr:RAMP superfamily CRISPR-associated protein [Desulfovibrio sp.]
MKAFLHPVRLCLTPLAPLHIGLGEDFDPTGYIIDDNVLYAFDPSQAALPDVLRQKLLEGASSGKADGIHRIYRLLLEYKDLFIPRAHSIIPVANGVAEKYRQSLGKPVHTESDLITKVYNNNYLERTVYLPGNGIPYLPGSSVKGAMSTAWLEHLYEKAPQIGDRLQNRLAELLERGNNSERFIDRQLTGCGKELEDDLLQGKFETSPMRLLKIADFMPQYAIARKIMFACNFKKNPVKDDGSGSRGRGPAARKEVILPGQYRSFISETVLHDLSGVVNLHTGKTPALRPAFNELAGYCNNYYRRRFEKERLLLLKRKMADRVGTERLSKLYRELRDRLDAASAFLIRLGRYGDAETKTIEGAARIKINAGKGRPPRYQKDTTTFWAAADSETQEYGLMPFGWALVEIDPQEDCRPLLDWCAEESRSHPDMHAVMTGLKEKRAEAERAEAAQKAAEAALKEQAEAEARARADREREQAAMSGEQRRLAEFCKVLGLHPQLKAGDAGAAVLQQVAEFLEAALVWPASERKECAESITPLLKEKRMFQGKRDKQFRDLLHRLRS